MSNGKFNFKIVYIKYCCFAAESILAKHQTREALRCRRPFSNKCQNILLYSNIYLILTLDKYWVNIFYLTNFADNYVLHRKSCKKLVWWKICGCCFVQYLGLTPVFKPNLCYRAPEFWNEVTWIEFLAPLAQTASDLFLLCLLSLPEAPALYQLSPLSFFPSQFNPPPSCLYWNILSQQFICTSVRLFIPLALHLSLSRLRLSLFSSYPSLNQQTQHFSICSAPLTYINPQTQIWEHVLGLIEYSTPVYTGETPSDRRVWHYSVPKVTK